MATAGRAVFAYPRLLATTPNTRIAAVSEQRRSNPRREPSRRLWLAYAVFFFAMAAPMIFGFAMSLWRQTWWFVPLIGGLAAAFVLLGLGCLQRARAS